MGPLKCVDANCSAWMHTVPLGCARWRMDTHASTWTHMRWSRKGLQSRDAIVEQEWARSFWGQLTSTQQGPRVQKVSSESCRPNVTCHSVVIPFIKCTSLCFVSFCVIVTTMSSTEKYFCSSQTYIHKHNGVCKYYFGPIGDWRADVRRQTMGDLVIERIGLG